MSRRTLSLLLTLLFSGMSIACSAEELSPEQLQQIESLQRRADRLAFGDVGSGNYHLAKARAWLDMAINEYYDKDASGLVSAAAAQAEALLNALEQKQPGITMDTPMQLPGSEPVRADLWDRIAKLKSNADFSCGQRQLAEAEVQLVWTGHEKAESGWSHAESYARGAEDRVYEAQAAIENCNRLAAEKRAAALAAAAPPPPPPPPAPAPATPPVAITVPVVVEKFVLATDTLFEFRSSELARGAAQRLDKIAESINGWSTTDDITLVGHTDHFGSAAYNQKLSEARAERIRQYLIGKGIPAEKIHASGAGATQPLLSCSSTLPKQEQVSCLQPNRRVEITLRGVKK